MIWFSPEFLAAWEGKNPTLDDIFEISGEVYREPSGANRRTLRFELGGRAYFLKLHWGVGWGEIVKNIVNLRMPVLGAENEWMAIKRLEQIDVETMRLVGYGKEGSNPAQQRSFVITEELIDCVSLEDYCFSWLESPPPFLEKINLLRRVAEITRNLHENGINHRDYYICHFLLDTPWDGKLESLHLHLIDLHRVQMRNTTPMRWVIKDVGSLWFSAMLLGLTKRDLFRFMRSYKGVSLRQTLEQDAQFWAEVESRAAALDATRPEPKPKGAGA
jgi:heptose I phosphotransferase